jgi:hypothetical protein
VLKRLRNVGLYLKLSKFKLNAKPIGFIDFIVIPEGVEIEPDRIKTVTEWPMPTSNCNIQVFPGFANFYH